MIKDFVEYMWYLLTSPFKRVKKSINKWYVFCMVFGRRFDDLKEDFLRARDESMVATCCNNILPMHGADRGLTRYVGEHPENFRSRIAMCEENYRNGGTNEGIKLAVMSLGYDGVSLKSIREYYGDQTRWAEFIVLIDMKVDEEHPISLAILRKTVRKWKEVGAKDNYLFNYKTGYKTGHRATFRLADYKKFNAYFDYAMLDGILQMDGMERLDAVRKTYCIKPEYRLAVKNDPGKYKLTLHEKHNLYFIDGGWVLDGTKCLDAYQKTEVI